MLARLLRHRELDGQRLVERLAVLRVEILAVALGREPGVAVGRDHEVAVGHGRLLGARGVARVVQAGSE